MVGKVSLCGTKLKPRSNVKLMLLIMIERFRKIFAYQCYFRSEHVGAYLAYFVFQSIDSTVMCLCLAHKAAPEIESDINLAFRPDDNHQLVVHEYSGLEPGDAQGLRTICDFITNRTDPSRAPAERLHAIW